MIIHGFTFSGTKLLIAGIENGAVACMASVFYFALNIHTGTQAGHIERVVVGGKLYSHWNTLFHLYEITGRIVLRYQRETGSRGAGYGPDHAREYDARNSIDLDVDLLVFGDVGRLRLLVIGYDPYVIGVDYVDYRLSGLYQLALLYVFAPGSAVTRCKYNGVRKVQTGKVEGPLPPALCLLRSGQDAVPAPASSAT